MILFTSLTVVDEDEVYEQNQQISCGDISIFFNFPVGSNLNDIFLKEKSKYYNFYKKGNALVTWSKKHLKTYWIIILTPILLSIIKNPPSSKCKKGLCFIFIFHLRGCNSFKVSKPIISQSWVVADCFVLAPCELFVHALFLFFHDWWQWSYFFSQGWSPKENHWDSWFWSICQDPVPHTLKPPIGQNLQNPINKSSLNG